MPVCGMNGQLCQPKRRTNLLELELISSELAELSSKWLFTKQKQISGKPFKCNLCGHFQHQPAKRQGSPLSLLSSPWLSCPFSSQCSPVNPLQTAVLSPASHKKPHLYLFTQGHHKVTPCPPGPHPALCEEGARQSTGSSSWCCSGWGGCGQHKLKP